MSVPVEIPRLDHEEEAVGSLFGWNGLVNVQENWRELVIAEAQVHATLAVAEQLRIANLISFVQSEENLIGASHTAGAIMDAQEQIREGLGLV